MCTKHDGRYDRQIRVFGFATQERIERTSVAVHTEHMNHTAAEVVKNIVLLGVTDVCISRMVEQCVLHMLPDGVRHINEHLHLTVCDTREDVLAVCGSTHVLVMVDGPAVQTACTVFYVCSACCSFRTHHGHACVPRTGSVETECLLGAVLVQKIVKMLSGETYQTEYTIDI